MTNEQITQWARDVGMMEKYQVFYACQPELQAFATLVRNATLEEAATVCMGIALKPSNVILGVAVDCANEIRSMKS